MNFVKTITIKEDTYRDGIIRTYSKAVYDDGSYYLHQKEEWEDEVQARKYTAKIGALRRSQKELEWSDDLFEEKVLHLRTAAKVLRNNLGISNLMELFSCEKGQIINALNKEGLLARAEINEVGLVWEKLIKRKR